MVIVGRWNRAILTPNGIAKRVFRLDDAGQMQVLVPLDGISPYQVRHPTQNIIATTDESRLLIYLAKLDYETLKHAMAAGVNALTSLPETPVSAAGFNVNFHATETTTWMARSVLGDVDGRIDDLGYKTAARKVSKSLEYGDGRLNVSLGVEPNGFTVSCNFHRGSSNLSDLQKWLRTPVDGVQETVGNLLGHLGLELEENDDEVDRD